MKLTDIKIGNKVFFIDVHPNDVAHLTRVARYEYERTCQKCKQDKGSTSQPCPYCNKSTMKAGKVKLIKLPKPAGLKIVSVESASRPGVFYKLRCVNGKVTHCECPGFKYRKTCHHAKEYNDVQTMRKMPVPDPARKARSPA